MTTSQAQRGRSAGRVLTGARVVTPHGVLDDGWVHVVDERIAAVGTGAVPAAGRVDDLAGGWLLPAFVDVHMHGGGGNDVTASAAELARAVEFHRAHGTGHTLVSLVTAPIDRLCEQLARIADLAERDARVLGAHLEGPFLSSSRCGAQNPAHLLAPDRGALAELIVAARGWLRTMTLAPELPGALDLVEDLVAAGVTAAVGHTDATYEQTAAAFCRGATLATHLYNGMRPVHHREPGPVLAALDSSAACEIVNDGVHVHPAVVREVLARGADRLILVTDAIAAAGAAPGRYQLGGLDIAVSDGEARLTSDGSLAGSVLTLDEAVRRAVRDGIPVELAARAGASNPAALLGLEGRTGAITPGLAADFVLLGEDLRLRSTMLGDEHRPDPSVTGSPPGAGHEARMPGIWEHDSESISSATTTARLR